MLSFATCFGKGRVLVNFIKIYSLLNHGLDARLVSIEVLKTRGLSQLRLTGLPDAWLKDSRDKIQAIVGQFGSWGPLDRLLVNLLPAEESKNGAHLELPIALGCLCALSSGQLGAGSRAIIEKYKFVGSLNLEGGIASTGMSEALEARDSQMVLGASRFRNLQECWSFVLAGRDKIPPRRECQSLSLREASTPSPIVEGRAWEKFWIHASAVARLPVAILGPPGTGKSTLAKWAYDLLPDLDSLHEFEKKQIWTLAGLTPPRGAPLMAPHSRTQLSEFLGSMAKGNSKPGIFALSHGGLLILDELLEMNHDSREILRTILDQKKLMRTHQGGSQTWPADFWLIATSNPCPCGRKSGEDQSECKCSASLVQAYQTRFSGPLYDRFGLKLFVSERTSQENNATALALGGALYNSATLTPAQITAEGRKILPDRLTSARAALNALAFRAESVRDFENKIKLLAGASCLSDRSMSEIAPFVQLINLHERSLFHASNRPSFYSQHRQAPKMPALQ